MKRIKKERKSLISVRGGFSDLYGIRKCNTTMQVNEFDNRTRVKLSNVLYDALKKVFESVDTSLYIHFGYDVHPESDYSKAILSELFNVRTRLKQGYLFSREETFKKIDEVFENGSYSDILDILWFTHKWFKNNYRSGMIIKDICNKCFEKEYVGYRFIGDTITPITDECETSEIEQTLATPYLGCKSHINKSLGFLSNRENPDYKNSIKESLSAVEAICKVIVDKNSATLPDAIKGFKKKGLYMHPLFEEALKKLYNYTSDEGGVRHAERYFESDVTFEQAKFMVITSCAFVNYLIAEYGKIK